jgi:hypothetical protein
MIVDLILFSVILFFLGAFVIFILFLPAIIELLKPRDRGPRVIMSELPLPQVRSLDGLVFLSIVEIEEIQKFDSFLIRRISDIIEFLPSLEV